MTYNVGGAIIEPDRFELTGTTSHYDYIGALLPSSGRGGKNQLQFCGIKIETHVDEASTKDWLTQGILKECRSASSGSAAPSNAQKHSHQK